MKKISIFCIAMVLIMSFILSGCSGKSDGSGAGTDSGQPAGEASEQQMSEANEESTQEEKAEETNLFDYAFAIEGDVLASKTVAFGTSSEDTLTQLGLSEDAMLNDTTFGIRRITRTIEGDGYMNGMTEIYNYAENKLTAAAYVITVTPDQLETTTVELAGLFGSKMPADWTTSDTTKYARRYSWKDSEGTKLDILISKNPNAEGLNEINISLTLDSGK